MKKLLFLLFFFCLPLFAHAQESSGIVVSPRIIDEKVKAGDILKYDVSIKNDTDRKVDIYAVVNDISQKEGTMEFLSPAELDKETSVARWISFKRGVIELMPGEETTVPLKIDVPGVATPGKRYARIAFPYGSNRSHAAGTMKGKAYTQLLINIEVVEEVIEKAQIKNFSSVSNVYIEESSSFLLTLHNYGNQAISPRGSIFIYNRRGEEVAQLEVNPESQIIASDETWESTINWDQASGFGKFKARLELEYGKKGLRDLQDTVFFWIFPWKILLIIFSLFFVFLVLMIALIFRRTYHHHHLDPSQYEEEDSNDDGVLNLKK